MSALLNSTAKKAAVASWLALTLAVLFLVGDVRAQVQEQRLDEILHADRNKTSDFAGKSFAASPAYGGKRASVQAFAFSHPAVVHSGDGSFQTRPFASKDGFRTSAFATGTDRVAGSDAFALRDKGYATKALSVQDDRAVGKSAAVREYVPAQKGIVIRGKRQETLDEIRELKDLSIDEVREILNKPNGRPGTHPAVETLPVMRALPVPAAPNAQ